MSEASAAHKVANMDQARALKTAREILHQKTYATGVVWKHRIRYEWMTGLKRPVLVELLCNGDLRVTDSKTREVITQGPAWVQDRISGGAA